MQDIFNGNNFRIYWDFYLWNFKIHILYCNTYATNYYLPRKQLAVIGRLKNFYVSYLYTAKSFPKVSRYSLGKRADEIILNILEATILAEYQPIEKKLFTLEHVISRIDVLKILLQILWEGKFFSDAKYLEFSNELLEIGRIMGGWKKAIQTKLPIK